MINDLFTEIKDVLALITIIAYVVLVADIYDRQVFWEETYQEWTVNEDCDSDHGFSKAIIKTE